jgi:hypothetical protein
MFQGIGTLLNWKKEMYIKCVKYKNYPNDWIYCYGVKSDIENLEERLRIENHASVISKKP